MPFKLQTTSGEGSPPPPAAWTRPADWLAMPASVAGRANILVAVFPTGANYFALSATVVGGYTVDWGDGTVENVASGVQANHLYSYADADLNGTECSRGYKQAIVKVYPQGANPITAIVTDKKYAGSTYNYINPILDMEFNLPSCTTWAVYNSSSIYSKYCERVVFTAFGAVTAGGSMFSTMTSLQSVVFCDGFGASLTSCATMFVNCSALTTVTLPAGFGPNVTTCAQMFQSCSKLTSVSLPTGFAAPATTIASMFLTCSLLTSITIPASVGTTGAGLNVSGLFNGCSSLTTISISATLLSTGTDFSNMFNACASLRTVNLTGLNLNAINLTSMFAGCTVLQEVIFPATFGAALTTLTNTFNASNQIRNIDNYCCPITFSVASMNLDTAALDALFTDLPTVTAKTVTVTGCPGAATCNTAIATGKGWTVTT